MDEYHIPVLLREAIDGLCVTPGEWYVDGTLGGGGHTWELLARGGNVIGIDADIESIEYVRSRWAQDKEKFAGQELILVHGNFSHMASSVSDAGKRIRGVILDLGVSSHQLNTPERGFSYRFGDAPIDLRMDRTVGISAQTLIHESSKEELYEIIAKYGEEERARSIADAIVRARQIAPIITTGQLLAVVSGVKGIGKDTASVSRVFQALRMAVNDELPILKRVFCEIERILPTSGRVAIISFHSLEDRLVKQLFQSPVWRAITKKPIVASDQEVQVNRRSRSAKLRIAEKI